MFIQIHTESPREYGELVQTMVAIVHAAPETGEDRHRVEVTLAGSPVDKPAFAYIPGTLLHKIFHDWTK